MTSINSKIIYYHDCGSFLLSEIFLCAFLDGNENLIDVLNQGYCGSTADILRCGTKPFLFQKVFW